ncbi:MAG: CvpA family protein [Vulcanibacillus sp.]
MNILDIIIIVVVILFILKGYQAGLVKQIINFFGYIVALIVAYKYYWTLSPYLEAVIPLPSFETSSLYMFSEFFNWQDMFYNAIAFILIFIGVKILLAIILVILEQVVRIPGLAIINRTSGALIGLVESLIIVILLVNFISIMPWASMQTYIDGSIISNSILEFTPNLTEKIFSLWDSTQI